MPFGLTFYDLASFISWFFIYSFGGWVWEVLLSVYKHHRFVNRGFVFGPVLPIYGVGALVAIVLLHPIANPVVQFVVGCAAAAVMEYTTSWVMEKLFHARWWDYSDQPLNLNGRICLLGILLFGTLMLVVDRVVQPWLASLTGMVDHDLFEVICGLAVILFVADLSSTVVRMKSFAEKLSMVQAKLGEVGDSARTLVSEARDRATDALDEAKLKAGTALDDVRERAGDAVDDMRERTGDVLDGIEERVRAALGQLPRPSFFDRRTLDDPYFSPTRNTEAFNLIRERLGKRSGGKGADASKASNNK